MFENTADFVESANLVCFPYRELANVNQTINFSLEKNYVTLLLRFPILLFSVVQFACVEFNILSPQ